MRSLMLSTVCAAFVGLAGCGSDAPGYVGPDAGNHDGPMPDAYVPPICCVTPLPDAGSTGGPDAETPSTDAGVSGETDGNVGATDGGSGTSDVPDGGPGSCTEDDDCAEDEVCLDNVCTPEDGDCECDCHLECAEPDPYDNHCNGHGHHHHGNGHGYGHCHHHEH